ncbi:MAG: hypothetical protein GY862_13890 [Gammaproteobacteria bacterium]|nr:hypothetical protein [Gammaproteobacteria bacterium]
MANAIVTPIEQLQAQIPKQKKLLIKALAKDRIKHQATLNRMLRRMEAAKCSMVIEKIKLAILEFVWDYHCDSLKKWPPI